MFKKVGIAVLALALVACSPGVDKDKLFLEYARSHPSLETARITDSDLLELAQHSCAALKIGATMRDLARVATTAGDMPLKVRTDIAGVIGFGVSTYCPELNDNTLNNKG